MYMSGDYFQGLTGVRIGLILQAFGTVVTALFISFLSSWKLTFVVLSFTPLIMLTGKVMSQKEKEAGQEKHKSSYIEQGGEVKNMRNMLIDFYLGGMCHFV